MSAESVQQKFTAALDALIAQVKLDRSVLAAILCGSLSHDTVWAQSDIDLALVTIDEKKAPPIRSRSTRTASTCTPF
jgi:predicted nucleotidyltransferase